MSILKELCQVTIETQNGVTTGFVSGFKNNIQFNPLTALLDLSNTTKPIFPCLEPIFSWNYKHEYGLGIKTKIDNPKQYATLVTVINNMLYNRFITNTSVSLAEVEFLKPFFDITFQFTPFIPDYRTSTQNIEIPAHYLTCPLDRLLNVQTTSYSTYFYQCFSLSDMIFSILHFLAINEYKIAQCEHCGRYFATLSLKQEYCPRNSTYPGKEDYSCYDAVKRIRQELRRKYRTIYSNLHAYYMEDHQNAFYKSFNDTFDKVKKCSNYENIDACYKTLVNKQWYTKDIVKNVGVKIKE